MKHATLIAAALLPAALLAQTTVTVSAGPGNAQQAFYSLPNGIVGTAPLAEWDLAFEIAGYTSSILVNTARGINAYETGAAPAQWASVNTANTAAWTPIYNAETSWSTGALNNGNNLSEPDGLNVGWGLYNMTTHIIAGNKVYVLEMPGGAYLKLRINSLASGVFDFTYADLDGTNEHNHTVVKSAYLGKNFAYWNLSTHTALDREPATASWDLLFTKYTAFVPTAYGVTGVLQNKGVEALQVDGVPVADAEPWSGTFSADINIIGSDWKTYNAGAMAYEYAQDRTYFVKDQAANIWKLVFTGYGGSANGNITFTQELYSLAGVDEAAAPASTIAVYPNPVQGVAQLVVDAPAGSYRIEVLDMAGRAARTERFTAGGGLSRIAIDAAALTPGLYQVRLVGDRPMAAARLVVQ